MRKTLVYQKPGPLHGKFPVAAGVVALIVLGAVVVKIVQRIIRVQEDFRIRTTMYAGSGDSGNFMGVVIIRSRLKFQSRTPNE